MRWPVSRFTLAVECKKTCKLIFSEREGGAGEDEAGKGVKGGRGGSGQFLEMAMHIGGQVSCSLPSSTSQAPVTVKQLDSCTAAHSVCNVKNTLQAE